MSATSKPALKRIMREFADWQSNPPRGVVVSPLEENMFEWHFTIRGVEKTEFEGGRYHGKLMLPSEYPFKPPDLIMLTPSGRFETGKKICLNFSGFHPESWRPSWTIRTMLVALRAFMETPGEGAIGAIEVNKTHRKRLAAQSRTWACEKCGIRMCDTFADDEDIERQPDTTDTETDSQTATVAREEEVQPEQADPEPAQAQETTATVAQVAEVMADTVQALRGDVEPVIPVENIEEVAERFRLASRREPSLCDQFYDILTYFLLAVMVSILFKKFAVRFYDKL